MPIIAEAELIKKLSSYQKVLLIEPSYKRKYIPLGLAKISAFLQGNGSDIVFSRSIPAICKGFDAVCITSLFTYDSKIVFKVISDINRIDTNGIDILIGGIFASLAPKEILSRYPMIYLFQGYSKILDSQIPDYQTNWFVQEPWDKCSFIFTSRGCPNNCPYCAVPKIEKGQWINPDWKSLIMQSKSRIMIHDNNLSAMPRDFTEELLGVLARRGSRIIFDNGFDCKFMDKDLAKLLSHLKILPSGLRMAFDRIEEDGIFQKAVEILLEAGISKDKIMAFVLFNFNDKPQDAQYRAMECRRLGIRPYPQMYIPLSKMARNPQFIGKYWTKNLAHAFRSYWLFKTYSGMEFGDWGKQQNLSLADWNKWDIR